MRHQPRKRFGQNFLINQTFIQKILQSLHLQATDQVVEIGPGLGALTKPLLNTLNTLTAIEIDNDLAKYLSEMPDHKSQLTVINQDALNFDYTTLTPNTRIVGNLPYNISTPLLFCLLRNNTIQDMHFMLQKEVVDRLHATPHNKNYGRLSIMIQYHCQVEPLFNVPSSAFNPAPAVESAFVRLIPYKQLPYTAISVLQLETIVTQAFSKRRKMLTNSLKSIFSADELGALGIDTTARAEELTVADYVRLSNSISARSLSNVSNNSITNTTPSAGKDKSTCNL